MLPATPLQLANETFYVHTVVTGIARALARACLDLAYSPGLTSTPYAIYTDLMQRALDTHATYFLEHNVDIESLINHIWEETKNGI